MTLTEYVIGGAILMIVGFLYNSLRSKINCKMSQPLCDERHGHTVEELKKGDAKFEKVIETQVEMLQTLARIEERVNDK